MVCVQQTFHFEYDLLKERCEKQVENIVTPEYGRPCVPVCRAVTVVPSCNWSRKYTLQVPIRE